jgi:hypothetical protein
MANPPRQKGTTEETAIVNEWNAYFPRRLARRMPAASRYDIHVDGAWPGIRVVDVLSTRADRGERLVTIRFEDFMSLWSDATTTGAEPTLHIESKRYARTAIGTIFEKKFGRKR